MFYYLFYLLYIFLIQSQYDLSSNIDHDLISANIEK